MQVQGKNALEERKEWMTDTLELKYALVGAFNLTKEKERKWHTV